MLEAARLHPLGLCRVAAGAIALVAWSMPAADAAADRSRERSIVIIWSEGAVGHDDKADDCPWSITRPWRIPRALLSLERHGFKYVDPGSGERVEVEVDVTEFCDPDLRGDFVAGQCWSDPTSCRGPKVCARSNALVRHLAERYRGRDRREVFLAGHSTGAWASMLVKRSDPGLVNGVLAFAPAFANKRSERIESAVGQPHGPPSATFARMWDWMWRQQREHLAAWPAVVDPEVLANAFNAMPIPDHTICAP